MKADAHISAGEPRPLFEVPSYGFDIFPACGTCTTWPDGAHFLVLAEPEAYSLTVVTNHTSALAVTRE
jgi:hypothetical protein